MNAPPDDPLRYALFIAHQLKSPIVSAISTLELLAGDYYGELLPKQKQKVEAALFSCHESIDAVERLLFISRAVHNPETLRGSCNIFLVFQELVESYSAKAKERGVQLSAEIDLASGFVAASTGALQEVLRALLDNSIKYTPEHGTVLLSAAEDTTRNTVRITLSDSGIGIPDEEREKVFLPFFRSKIAKQSVQKGTGLGLALVKSVVEALGGKVFVGESPLGGTAIILEIAKVTRREEKMRHPQEANMRILIIGGVAAGPKVASKIMRLKPNARVTLLERGKFLSYAGCGLPYYISGEVESQETLMSSPCGAQRDAHFFRRHKSFQVLNQTGAVEIDRAQKAVRVRSHVKNEESWLEYDRLVLATGAVAKSPLIDGTRLKNVFTLHGVKDAEGIKSRLDEGRARDAVIVGGGLVAIEVTEALVRKGARVTIVEDRKSILNMLDIEMAQLVEKQLEANGVRVLVEHETTAICGEEAVEYVETSGGVIRADMVILAMGCTPEVTLARDAGLAIGPLGGLLVHGDLSTSDPDIYAAGDCIESTHCITKEPCYEPLGSSANKQGRLLAKNLCGGKEQYPATPRTIACKVFSWTVARTGLSEHEAREAGKAICTATISGYDRDHYSPGAKEVVVKIVAEKGSRRVLGAQAVGAGRAEKPIDVAAMAIIAGFSVEQLGNAPLCYHPEVAPVLENIMVAANVAANKLDGLVEGISSLELQEKLGQSDGTLLLDVRPAGAEPLYLSHETLRIPLSVLREREEEVPRDKEIIILSTRGLHAYEASLILRAAGCQKVKILDGGVKIWGEGLGSR